MALQDPIEIAQKTFSISTTVSSSSNTANHGRPLILLKTHVVLVRVACGSNVQRHVASKLIPALYEKAQAPE